MPQTRLKRLGHHPVGLVPSITALAPASLLRNYHGYNDSNIGSIDHKDVRSNDTDVVLEDLWVLSVVRAAVEEAMSRHTTSIADDYLILDNLRFLERQMKNNSNDGKYIRSLYTDAENSLEGVKLSLKFFNLTNIDADVSFTRVGIDRLFRIPCNFCPHLLCYIFFKRLLLLSSNTD